MSSYNEWIRAINQLQKMLAESEFARNLAAAQRALDELAKSEFARNLVAAQRAAENALAESEVARNLAAAAKALGESEVARILADVQSYLTGPDGAKLAEAIKRAQANLALFDQLSPETDEDEPETDEDEDE